MPRHVARYRKSAADRRRSRRLRTEHLEQRIVLDSTVVFNEVMYHPADDPAGTMEWIELHNQLVVDMDISEWSLAGGVDFTFAAGTVVPGRGYLVVAADPAALAAATGFNGALGPFTGRLSNSGEELRLFNNDNRLMNSLDYRDSGDWPVGPDGSDTTLAKRFSDQASEVAANWVSSLSLGGTPGELNVAANVAGESGEGIVINEIVQGDTPDFWVELTNRSTADLSLDGLQLSATGAQGGTHTFGAQTLSPGEFVVVNQATLGFRATAGDRVFLYGPNQDELLDARAVTNRLRGRAEEQGGQWLYPSTATPGSENTFDFQTDVVINEIMYHASPQLADGQQSFEESTEEWVELFNRGAQPVDLTGWAFDDGISFDFAPGTVIQPGGYLVLSNDAATLSAKYPGIDIVGNFGGVLSNKDDRLLLRDAAKNPVDEVHYYERGKWAELADGGGSSLELRDPLADNSQPAAWAASEEGSKSEWTTYQFSGLANEPLNCCGGFNEFIFGLLDSGEFLIDDISVILDGTSTELIQNGTFDSGRVGTAPARWRLIGTHSGVVDVDPDDPSNKVLHVTSSGPQQHVHDHAESTFAGNTAIVNNARYNVSFRTKWLGGGRQLNNRLYFTRMSNTAVMAMPELNGTPGAVNSSFEENIGPTYSHFAHEPVLPKPSEVVTVTARAEDPQGVDNMTLWWKTESGDWNSEPMTAGVDGMYSGEIPGQRDRIIVQFYVEGRDTLGAVSTFPAAGQDSWAMFQTDGDGLENPPRPVDTFRMILPAAVNNTMRSSVNLMSNKYRGTTIVINGEKALYDVEVRMIGSRFIRPNSGYRVRLHPDEKLYGVHDSIRFDVILLNEILMKQMVNRAGGSSTSLYDDISFLVSPSHTQSILLSLARYEDVFLNEQFDNGGDGTKYELDDIVFPTGASPAPEGLKTGTGVSSPDMQDRGDNPEAYRGHLLIKNNRALDDYDAIVRLSDAINRTGDDLDQATQAVMDVDLWMRHYATQSFLGNWDTYGFRRPKNLRIYVRPEDNKIIPLYWDADRANFTEPFIYNGGASRLDEIRDIPHNRRLFWGHMWDLTNRAFNGEYVATWAAHYNSLGAGTSGLVSRITSRAASARAAVRSAVRPIEFNVSTPDPLDVGMSGTAALTGRGWVDVRQIKLVGDDRPLEVNWTGVNIWEVDIPVAFGTDTYTLEAFDFEGNSVGTTSIDVTSSLIARPLVDFLRVTEQMFHPTNPSVKELAAGFNDDSDFEFIELTNTGPDVIDLAGAQFTAGISFDFTGAAVSTLGPGEHVLVVRDEAAFDFRYGAGLPVAGEYSGKLDNSGEQIRLENGAGTVILDYVYDNAWYPTTDGDGHSLVIVDAEADSDTWSDQAAWRASTSVDGSPGESDSDRVPGDATGDGKVDIDDLNAVRNNFGGAGLGDTDGDEDVDIDDLNNVRNNFGATAAPLQISAPIADLVFERAYRIPARHQGVRRIDGGSLRRSALAAEAFDQTTSVADAALESRLASSAERLGLVRHLPRRAARRAAASTQTPVVERVISTWLDDADQPW